MKTIKVISVLTIALFTFWACEKAEEEMGPEEEAGLEEELLGTWMVNFLQTEVTLTTNKDQTVLDRSSQGDGAIEVTGADTTTLTYITDVWLGEYDTCVTVSNRALDAWGSYPMYHLWGCRSEGDSWLELSVETQTDYRGYYGDVDFSFDPETYTLTIDGVVLYTWEGDESVTVRGTLTGTTIEIPANTPFMVAEDTDDDPDQTLRLKEDEMFIWIFSDKWFDSGSWELDGDTLTLYVEHDGGEILHFTYTLSGDNLTLESKEDPCWWADDSMMYAWCLEDFEYTYDLERGCLASIEDYMLLELSRSSDELLAQRFAISDQPNAQSIRDHLFGRKRKPHRLNRFTPHE